MKNLLLLVLTMAAVTSCVAPRVVNYKAVPDANLLIVKCDGDAHNIVSRDLKISKVDIYKDNSSSTHIEANKRTEKADLRMVVTFDPRDSSVAWFGGFVVNRGVWLDAENSNSMMKVGWNEIVNIVEDGTCEITESRVLPR